MFQGARRRRRSEDAKLTSRGDPVVNPLADLDPAPVSLEMLQLALAFVFLTCYALTIGSFFGTRGKLRAAAVAVIAVALFCTTTTPWAMGIVWAALAIGAIGVFVGLTLLTSRLLGLDGRRVGIAPSAPAPTVRTPRASVKPGWTVPGGL